MEAKGGHNLPPWVVMDKEDLEAQSQKIGWMLLFVEAADFGRCRRPRLYWIKNIPIIKGSDVGLRLEGKIRDVAIPLDEVELTTEKPPLECREPNLYIES